MMEKKIWTKPEVGAVVFPANAYCSTCAASGSSISGDGHLFFESGANDGFQFDSSSNYSNSFSTSSYVSDHAGEYGTSNFYQWQYDYATERPNGIVYRHTSDQIINFSTTGTGGGGGARSLSSEYLWTNSCDDSGHSHDSSNAYTGYFVSTDDYASLVSGGDNTGLWSRVSIWWTSTSSSALSTIHAVFADGNPS